MSSLLIRLGQNVSNIGRILFHKHPVITNSVLVTGLFMTGDAIEQTVIEKHKWKSYEFNRTFKMGLIAALSSPIWYKWYAFLHRYFKSSQICTKIALDQVFLTPLDYVYFYVGVGLLEGQSFQECKTELGQKFLYTYFLDTVVWLPVMYVNFRFIPLPYQVVFLESIQLSWTTFLSYMKHYDRPNNAGKKLQNAGKKELAADS